MTYALETFGEFLQHPFLLTWFEIRAFYYWLFLWWKLPREIAALQEYAQKGYISNNEITYTLDGHRFVNMVHLAWGIYGAKLTLRGSVAIWLASRGRVWKAPEAPLPTTCC